MAIDFNPKLSLPTLKSQDCLHLAPEEGGGRKNKEVGADFIGCTRCWGVLGGNMQYWPPPHISAWNYGNYGIMGDKTELNCTQNTYSLI